MFQAFGMTKKSECIDRKRARVDLKSFMFFSDPRDVRVFHATPCPRPFGRHLAARPDACGISYR
jgi:hypothetical protein